MAPTSPQAPRGRRTVELIPAAVAALEEQRFCIAAGATELGGGWVDEGWVFPSKAGTRWDLANYRKLFKKACEDAEIGNWSPHELRHTAASWLIAQRLPLKFIADALGHSSVTVTADVYGHLLFPSAEIADAFNQLVTPPIPTDPNG